MLSLLRLINTSGNVYYDGLSTSSINLEDLRRNITIIPQIVGGLFLRFNCQVEIGFLAGTSRRHAARKS